MKWLNVILPVLTLVLGYVGTLVTEGARDSRARQLAKQERQEANSDARATERRTFELDTLSDTAEALARFSRAVGRAHIHDVMAARHAGSDKYLTGRLPADINDELYDSNRALARLEGLLLEQRARDLVEHFRGEAGKLSVMNTATVAEAEAFLLGAITLYDQAQATIAARIRGIYEGSVTTS